jgi:hypothetical protein
MGLNRKRLLAPLAGLIGLFLLAGILYQSGFKITTKAQDPEELQARQPREHARRLALTEKQTGQAGEQANAGATGRRASAKRQSGKNRPVTAQAGRLGAETIAVVTAGKASSFTGEDLQKLEQTTVASNHGARAGWRVADVMKSLAIAQAQELVIVSKDGNTLHLPWAKVMSDEPTLILAYNQFGGLMLFSGQELTPEELQTTDNRAVKAAAMQNRDNRLFLANIVKIEVKS